VQDNSCDDEVHEGRCKLDVGRRMPGPSLSRWRSGKTPLGKPAFLPYWGKPAVRN